MDRSAVIIGGTSGIGLETARKLRDAGYDVLIGGRSEVKETGIVFSAIDVTDEFSVKNFFDSLSIDKLDALVFSAGTTTSKKDITEFSVEEYYRVHDVNLLGAILVLKYAFPLLEQTAGKVVIVSSFAARTYSAFSGFEYTVSKAGLSGLVKQLAVEWGRKGVLINSVFPSMVETPMLLDNVEFSVLKKIKHDIPLGRIAQPEDVVSAIEFLLSETNQYITGAGFDVNGGQYLSA